MVATYYKATEVGPRPLLIGISPGPGSLSRAPLYPIPATRTGGRLADLSGLGAARYLRTFERMNLIQEPADESPEKARSAANAVRQLLQNREVILVGAVVARAFKIVDTNYHEWHEVLIFPAGREKFRCAIIPHPSGRNRWYNDQSNKDEASRFWAEFLRGREI